MTIATADIGGTFTDIALLDSKGRLRIEKRLSTRHDYSEAVAAGISELLGRAAVPTSAVRELRHGTTVATNAILERQGARTALVTTKGFRDVLEIGRLRTPRLYDINWKKPAPLVPRRYRREVTERISADGAVLVPLDEKELEELAVQLVADGIESIAICFINSYVNDAHEVRAREILTARCPDVNVSISSEILREMREFERTSTTVADAYVRPAMRAYLRRLAAGLRHEGIASPIYVMQSNGGVLSLEETMRRPVYAIESGPAAGIIAARRLCSEIGIGDAITFDMGGTTAKASIIEGGRIEYSPEFEIGGEVSRNSRLIKGSGYLIRTPAIDVAEVGAGGGSIAWVDAAGGLKVGPRSAGSSPGPACYGLGGTEATVTDANLMLGLLSPDGLAGGAVPVDPCLAGSAVERVARAIGLSPDETALGIHDIAVANMARAIRSVSTERGRDLRRFQLVAFGGNGPVFAAALARMFAMRGVIVPPNPGVFSAIGLLHAANEHHLVYTLPGSRVLLDDALIESRLPEYRAAALRDADRAAVAGDYKIEWHADMRYFGQGHDLRVAILDGDTAADVRRRFGEEHKLLYGHHFPDADIEVMNLRILLREGEAAGAAGGRPVPSRSRGVVSFRDCAFGGGVGRLRTRVLDCREALKDGPILGPALIEEYDSTIVVPPDFEARLDRLGNVLLAPRSGG